MISVSKSKLKAKMLEYFRRVEESGEEIIVTSHNKPVLKISRLEHTHTIHDVFSDIRGSVALDDSIMAPETDDWEEV